MKENSNQISLNNTALYVRDFLKEKIFNNLRETIKVNIDNFETDCPRMVIQSFYEYSNVSIKVKLDVKCTIVSYEVSVIDGDDVHIIELENLTLGAVLTSAGIKYHRLKKEKGLK